MLVSTCRSSGLRAQSENGRGDISRVASYKAARNKGTSPTSFPGLFPFELNSKGKSPGNEVGTSPKRKTSIPGFRRVVCSL